MPLSLLSLLVFAGEPWAPPIAELALNIQDKGVARLERCVSFGQEAGAWSSWQDACAEALVEHDPSRSLPGVEARERGTLVGAAPRVGPLVQPEP